MQCCWQVLPVPWLLFELILVMKLPRGVTESKGLSVMTGLVTTYHYVRILNSGVDGFSAVQSKGAGDDVESSTGAQFIDIYHCIGWLQKAP